MSSPVALDHARVVHHDRVESASLAFANGRVVEAQATGFRVDLRDHAIFPGLINAHDHLQLNNVPPLPHAELFANSYDWIEGFEAHRRRPDVTQAVAVPSALRHWQGALKNLLSGATTVAHHDPWNRVFDDPAFPVHVVSRFGWCHSLGLGAPHDGLPSRYGPPVRASFVATSPDRPWIIHLAEGTDAVAQAELARLDALGCLAPNTVLVHGVGLSADDMDRVIARGAALVWCPSSNLEMLGRTLDVAALFAADRLMVGTDSRLTGSRDLLDELRVAAARSRLSPSGLLRLVSESASRILRLPDRGALLPGRRADCLIVRDGTDPYEQLIATPRAEIRAVVRDGVPVVADPDFADWFAWCGIATVHGCLDGRPKLIAASIATHGATALEPGLDVDFGGHA